MLTVSDVDEDVGDDDSEEEEDPHEEGRAGKEA